MVLRDRWISPERFQNEEFRDALKLIGKKKNFALAVIDEVHCLSEWGHDFRVSYLTLIRTLRKYCPEVCLLGLTATASQAVLEDLKAEFGSNGSDIKALTSMDRPELLFQRIKVDSDHMRINTILKIIKENNIDYTNLDGTKKHQIGLIFCPTVKGKGNGCNNIVAALRTNSVTKKIAEYHGKMETNDRTKIQKNFMNGDYDVMVCTKAFGMGIDKDNVKYTIHSCLPQSVESFYQEAGRAGREKDKSVKSHCYIVYKPEREEVKDEIEKIFRMDTGIADRKELSKNLNNDLSTIMFFWNINKKSVEEDYEDIYYVLKKLYKGEYKLKFNNHNVKLSLNSIQTALYKLSILGIVAEWTIQYLSLDEGVVNVEYLGLDENKVREKLLEYIHKYDTEFKIDIDSRRYHKYYELVHKSDSKIIAQYIKLLIEWSNDNILYNRLQSTYTIFQWMNSDISDEEFRENLVEYFKFSEKTIIYEGIIHEPIQYMNWFDILHMKNKLTSTKAKPIDKGVANKELVALQRYLESYKENTGLNFLNGMLRLMTGKYVGTEGEWRFKEAWQNIKETFHQSDIDNIIDMTLEASAEMEISSKNQLSIELLNNFSGIEERIFEKLRDQYSLSILLEKPTERINYIVKEKL